MNKIVLVVLGCVALIAPVAAVDAPIAVPAGAKYLDEMDLADATCGARRTPRPRHTVEGGPISLAGKVFDRGLGVHAPFEFKFFANGAAMRFTANVGVDDDMKDRPRASVRFLVLADDRVAADSGVLRAGARAALDADLTDAKWVTLKVTDAGDGYACDHADWADAAFVFKPGVKWGNALLSRQLGILTPPESPAPRINGPSVFGVRPDHPILYRLPVTGERLMKLAVEGLPAGATFDAATGLLGGAVAKPGDYPLVFTAENARGVAKKNFTLKVGNTICLTPPLGWNSWNCWGQDVTDEKMRRAADAMVASGLADHGWSYIVVDDCWRTRPTEKEAGMKRPGWIGERAYMYGPARTVDDLPCTNPAFPDMRAMIAYIHAKGLKAGLYSVPATVACCWTWGSFGHEAKDAEVWADWGVDLLKYDWCTADRDWWRAGNDRERQFKAYKLMGDLLARQKRDIVYNVCNYGRHGVTEWARAAGGQYWRTNDDLKDTWPLLIRSINENMNVADAAGPGGWNDPDMLVVGPMRSNGFTKSRLTPNEQYAHMSLWAIMAAPLFIGCDLERLDPLARSLLTNDEMLDIDQDALGKAGRPVVHTPDYDVWLRPLADGSWAIALFNRTWEEREVAADFEALGLPASCAVRDVWAQKDLGTFTGRFAASIPGHAALLYRLRPTVVPTKAAAPVKIIFDTDMIGDYDDVGAMAVLHALADRGECEILATVSSTHSNASAGTVELLNAWYGRPDIPVGAVKGEGVGGGSEKHRSHVKYERLLAKYPKLWRHRNANDAPDATGVYRRALAAQPDGSVTICTVGFLTNLRRLLQSKPDRHSPLDGRALVARKVKAWYAMGWKIPKGRECNIMNDPASARYVLENWPTPIVIDDFNYSQYIYAGRKVAALPDDGNPVRDIFVWCMPPVEKCPAAAEIIPTGRFKDNVKEGHNCFDQSCVLAAVRGPGSFFDVERGRMEMVGDKGDNVWTSDPNGPHARMVEKWPRARVAALIDELMVKRRAD